jgi:hypothetical protein
MEAENRKIYSPNKISLLGLCYACFASFASDSTLWVES